MEYDGSTIKQWAGDSQWRAWRADLARFRRHGYSGWMSEGFWGLTIYRLQRSLRAARPAVLFLLPRLVVGLVKKMYTLVTHINLHPESRIGPGLLIPHVGPIQVVPGASLGADCAIHQVCTIGAGSKPGVPSIGDHVTLWAHCCVLGPVTVGDNAQVAAGAVVVKDVPPYGTAVGVPAKVIMKQPEDRPVLETAQ